MADTVVSSCYFETLRCCLSEISFRYRNPECFQLNSVQCKLLCDALACLSAHLFYFGDMYPNAWKQIYRAVKEAEIYLQHCSSGDWPIKFLTRSTTGEAYSIHLHDLALSRLLLDVIHIIDTGKICGNICDFYQEMDRRKICDFCHAMDCFEIIRQKHAIKLQLIKPYEKFAESSTHTSQDKNIIEVSKSLGGKLKETIPIQVSREDESAGPDTSIPTWLIIDPADLLIKSECGAIGEGSFGHVYEGSFLGIRVAAKEMPMDALDVFELEASVLAKLQSPFIVQLIGTCIKDSRLYLVMELVSSNLEQLLEDRSKTERPPLSLPVAVDIMLQISRAMEYLHRQGIMHLDLKASNFLFELSCVPESREEGYGRVKLCDFGTASTSLFSFRAPDPKGTSYWRAPEVFPLPYEDMSAETNIPETYTNKADVYSFAMTCYQILTGKQPFAGYLPRELYNRIVNGERPTLDPSICPFILARYIQQCWDTDPDQRPCFEAVSDFLRRLKILILKSRLHWNEALDSRFYSDFGFVDGEKDSIFLQKLKKWQDESIVKMHSRLEEMLLIWRFLTLKMRRKIAIDIASFLARIHGNSPKGFLYFYLNSSTIYLDWQLKPIFSGFKFPNTLGRGLQRSEEAKRFEEFTNIQSLGEILVELSTGFTWKEMQFSLASIQRFIECSELEFVDKQLVEEVGERQLWEVVRWCKIGLWCLSKSPSQQPNIQTVLQLLKEGAPSGDSTLQDCLSPIPISNY